MNVTGGSVHFLCDADVYCDISNGRSGRVESSLGGKKLPKGYLVVYQMEHLDQ